MDSDVHAQGHQEHEDISSHPNSWQTVSKEPEMPEINHMGLWTEEMTNTD